MKKAETIRECLVSLDNSDLTDENFDLFYEPIPREIRPDIVGKLDYYLTAEERFKKFVITGHRGVGKSTEIVRANRELRDKYHMILVNVNDATGTSGKSYTDVLVRIVDKVYEYLIERGIVSEDDELFDYLLNYWDSEAKIQDVVSEITNNETNVKLSAEIGAKISSKFKILSNLSTVFSVGLNVSSEMAKKYSDFNSVDEIVTRTIAKNDGIFLEALNNTLDAVQRKLGDMKLLIVLEDLDKDANADLVDEVFNKHVTLFARIRATMIFTMAVHYLYNDNIRKNLESLSMTILNLGILKIYDEDHKSLEVGLRAMKSVILKRIDASLIEDEALEYAVKLSGGLFRDLINILCSATLITGPEGRDKITLDDVKEATEEFELRYIRSLRSDEEVNKILEIYNGEEQFSVRDILRELLRKEAVLGYDDCGKNGAYRVHPLILQYLSRAGKIKWTM